MTKLGLLAGMYALLCSSLPVWATVTVKGCVHYWDRGEVGWKSVRTPQERQQALADDFELVTTADGQEGYVTSGWYRPAQQLRIEVEFNGITLDDTTYTDDQGRFEITHRDPLAGDMAHPTYRHWDVDVEVRALVRLKPKRGDEYSRVQWRPMGDVLDLYPYNGRTATREVTPGDTLYFDVYIGGPNNNIAQWAHDDTAGHHTQAAIFASQQVLRAYRWAVQREPTASQIDRDTMYLYPAGGTAFKPTLSTPPMALIQVSGRKLYPEQWNEADLQMGCQGMEWEKLRASVVHEYGHKIMHDVYWAWPFNIDNLLHSDHGPTTARNPELGWVEGWAEFFAAAVAARGTINGLPDAPNERALDIEKSWGDPGDEWNPQSTLCEWRDSVPHGKQAICEAENAAVLWDIHDPKGWELMPGDQQERARLANWPRHLQWYEALRDPDLKLIWPIVEGHDPDSLRDEDDLWQDSFWYYWLDEHGDSTEKVHGLKAILFNRGIKSKKKPERSPEIMALEVDGRRVKVTIREQDAEDRPYVRYNLAYRHKDTGQTRVAYRTDLVAGKRWSDDTIIVRRTLPHASDGSVVIAMVHDNMQATFMTWGSPLADGSQQPGAGDPLGTEGAPQQQGTDGQEGDPTESGPRYVTLSPETMDVTRVTPLAVDGQGRAMAVFRAVKSAAPKLVLPLYSSMKHAEAVTLTEIPLGGLDATKSGDPIDLVGGHDTFHLIGRWYPGGLRYWRWADGTWSRPETITPDRFGNAAIGLDEDGDPIVIYTTGQRMCAIKKGKAWTQFELPGAWTVPIGGTLCPPPGGGSALVCMSRGGMPRVCQSLPGKPVGQAGSWALQPDGDVAERTPWWGVTTFPRYGVSWSSLRTLVAWQDGDGLKLSSGLLGARAAADFETQIVPLPPGAKLVAHRLHTTPGSYIGILYLYRTVEPKGTVLAFRRYGAKRFSEEVELARSGPRDDGILLQRINNTSLNLGLDAAGTAHVIFSGRSYLSSARHIDRLYYASIAAPTAAP